MIEAPINGLPDEVLVKILKQLGFPTCRTIVPLVCKQWLQLTEISIDLWSEVNVKGPEEEEAFRILMRSNQTGGINLTADGPKLRIQREPIARWFHKHASAAISSLDFDKWYHQPHLSQISLELPTGALNSLLIALRGSLESFKVDNADWIHTEPYFADLAWLEKLKTLHIVMMGEDSGQVNITSADLASIGCLKELESFEFGWVGAAPNHAEIFPDAIFELPKLKRLGIGGLKPDFFSDRLSRLVGLTRLFLIAFGDVAAGGAPVDVIDGVVQQALTLTNLVTLNLSYCLELHHFPAGISALTALRMLRCIRTGFRELPVNQLRALPSLQEIDFSLCGDMVVTESVVDLAGLRRLRMLSLQGCEPTSSGQLGMLRFLNAVHVSSPDLRIVIEPRSDADMDGDHDKDPDLSEKLGSVLRIHV